MARQTTANRTRTTRHASATSRTASGSRSRSTGQGARRSRPTTARSQGNVRLPRATQPTFGANERAIQRFLESFTQSLTSGDGRATAACFEYPSLMVMSAVGEYGGTQAIRDADEAAGFFDQAPDQYHAKGVDQTFPDIQDVQWIAHDLALVRVHFPYLDDDGNDMGDGETSVYVVRKSGPGHTLCAAITLGTDGDRAAMD